MRCERCGKVRDAERYGITCPCGGVWVGSAPESLWPALRMLDFVDLPPEPRRLIVTRAQRDSGLLDDIVVL